MNRLTAVLIGLDMTINGLLTGCPFETLSASCFRKAPHGKKRWIWSRKIIDIIFFWDREVRDGKTIYHCQLSWENSLKRKKRFIERL